jgi:hypothetical protein
MLDNVSHFQMNENSPSDNCRDNTNADKMALLAGYYTYRNSDPSDIISEVIGSDFTYNKLIEKKNSIHIYLRVNDISIKYGFIKANHTEITAKSNCINEIDFLIYPRKLEIITKNLDKLVSLGYEVELKEFCFFNRKIGFILIKDGVYETPIRVNYLCSWFNMIFPLGAKIGKKDRMQKLLMYEKLITYNLRLELLT